MTTANAHTHTARRCLCGCGEAVSRRSNFRPGHDARLRGILQRAARGSAADIRHIEECCDMDAITRYARSCRNPGHWPTLTADVQHVADLFTSRTFGIEIEFANPLRISRVQIASKLRAAGLDVQNQSYNHRVQRCWKLITDSTCGLELVSPVLRGSDGIEQIKIAMRVLDGLGMKVNRSCGLHIHLGMDDMDAEAIRDMILSYHSNQELIDYLLAPSRRSAHYCRKLTRNDVSRLNRINSLSDVGNTGATRYKTVNVHSYNRYGTIEFRQHQGTLDGNKAACWIELLLGLADAARTNGRITRQNTIERLLAKAGVSDNSRRYLTARYNHFTARRAA